MHRATDPMSSIFKATMDAAERYAVLSLQEAECLFKCQMGVARELVAIAGSQLTQWSSESPSAMAGADWAAPFRANTERAMELTRACAEAATDAQSELARLSQEQVNLLGKMWRENIQGITRAAEAAGMAGVEPLEHKPKKAA